MDIKVVSINERVDLLEEGIKYFQEKWANPDSLKVYDDCIRNSFKDDCLPKWFLLLDGNKIIGCAGLISNDFISRMDLMPWLCALYVDEEYRHHNYGKLLIEKIKNESIKLGFNKLYLCTDHDGYYEKFDFVHIGMGYHPWGDSSKIYECILKEK